MKKVICPYCGKQAKYIDSKDYYSNGKSYGMIYICWDCDAIVGVHKGTDNPLGRLATRELRKLRQEAHASFDYKWQSGLMSRKQAYKSLAEMMDLPLPKAHIGMFNEEQCRQVIEMFS